MISNGPKTTRLICKRYFRLCLKFIWHNIGFADETCDGRNVFLNWRKSRGIAKIDIFQLITSKSKALLKWFYFIYEFIIHVFDILFLQRIFFSNQVRNHRYDSYDQAKHYSKYGEMSSSFTLIWGKKVSFASCRYHPLQYYKILFVATTNFHVSNYLIIFNPWSFCTSFSQKHLTNYKYSVVEGKKFIHI